LVNTRELIILKLNYTGEMECNVKIPVIKIGKLEIRIKVLGISLHPAKVELEILS
jgi:hypothetical protein